jgi:hypothetical protein
METRKWGRRDRIGHGTAKAPTDMVGRDILKHGRTCLQELH